MKAAFLVAGLGYGDEGKGATVDFLCREMNARLVVRYNGGPQAGHNVVTPEGCHHTFSQFGSGMFVSGCRTYLSPFMLINPLNMMNEAEALRSLGLTTPVGRTLIHEKCLVITPFQKAVNRIDQLLHTLKTSCGEGIGQARQDHLVEGNKVLFAGDLADIGTTIAKLKFHQNLSCSRVAQYGKIARLNCREHFDLLLDPKVPEYYANLYKSMPLQIVDRHPIPRDETVIFEGAQGVLLDETFGEHGFNTYTNTTFKNAETILNEVRWPGSVMKIGVIRTYLTRHGDGVFPSEDEKLDPLLPEPHNDDVGWQGKFRRGRLTTERLEYALRVCKVDVIAMNHCDLAKHVSPIPQIVNPLVSIRSYGPTAKDRSWS